MSGTGTNILVICTDQQRFDTINCAGNPAIRTPHLNWLCETGVRFSRCYTDSAVCCAARASLLTGRYYPELLLDNLGWWGQKTAEGPHATYAGLLTRAGYQSKAIGKHHFAPERCNYGFESLEILQDYYRYMNRHPHWGRPMDHGVGQNEMEPVISTVEESASLTRWTVERSIDFLETRDPTRPFLLFTGFAKPHPPFDPCRNYWELYARADVGEPVRGDWSASVASIPAGFMQMTWMLNGVDRLSPAIIRDARRAYYACITQIDYNLGYLFARMRELDLLDTTTIVFTSDHGEMLGDHHMGAKNIALEGAGHIPLIVRPAASSFDASLRGTVCDELVCLADIFPTVCAAGGVAIPAALSIDGKDLIRTAGGVSPRDRLVCRCDHLSAVVDRTHKYLHTAQGGGELLFNLMDDPYEQHNLVESQHDAHKRDELRGVLGEQLRREQSPAVDEKGFPCAGGPPPDRRTERARCWPGLHTRNCTSDVLH